LDYGLEFKIYGLEYFGHFRITRGQEENMGAGRKCLHICVWVFRLGLIAV